MKEHIKNLLEITGNGIVIAGALISGLTFWQVKFNGASFIYEGNDLILNIECCMVPLILAIGIINLILDIKRWRRGIRG